MCRMKEIIKPSPIQRSGTVDMSHPSARHSKQEGRCHKACCDKGIGKEVGFKGGRRGEESKEHDKNLRGF